MVCVGEHSRVWNRRGAGGGRRSHVSMCGERPSARHGLAKADRLAVILTPWRWGGGEAAWHAHVALTFTTSKGKWWRF